MTKQKGSCNCSTRDSCPTHHEVPLLKLRHPCKPFAASGPANGKAAVRMSGQLAPTSRTNSVNCCRSSVNSTTNQLVINENVFDGLGQNMYLDHVTSSTTSRCISIQQTSAALSFARRLWDWQASGLICSITRIQWRIRALTAAGAVLQRVKPIKTVEAKKSSSRKKEGRPGRRHSFHEFIQTTTG